MVDFVSGYNLMLLISGFDYSDESLWRFFSGLREVTAAGFLDSDLLPALREIPGLEDKLSEHYKPVRLGSTFHDYIVTF